MEKTRDFDREYGLRELVPRSTLDDLFPEIERLVPGPMGITTRDGTVYYSKGCIFSELGLPNVKTLEASRPGDGKVIPVADNQWLVLFPLFHELETIGWLFLAPKSASAASLELTTGLGKLFQKGLHHIMRCNYERLLTTGLHGQVVEESYQQLKRKAALLEESERKLRGLTQRLEAEVRKKAREIEKTQARLMQQEKMASIGQLAAGVAHEINNPIAFIKSNLGTLKDYLGDLMALTETYQEFEEELRQEEASLREEKLRKIIGAIEAKKNEIDWDFIARDYQAVIRDSLYGIERVSRIVSELKDFVDFDGEEAAYADLHEKIEDCLERLAGEFGEQVEVVRKFGNLPYVRCYPQRLVLAFENILRNAAQAIEGGGTIRICTKWEKKHAVFEFSDTGCGIPPDIQSRIFEPFFTTKDVGQGAGLGLHMAYNIVQTHHGTIHVQSEIGRGTTVTVHIPIEPF